MTEAELQKKRDKDAARQRKKRSLDAERAEKLGMAPKEIDLADGESRRWLTQSRASDRSPEEYFVWLLLRHEKELIEAGVDLSQFEITPERDSHTEEKEVA